MSDRLKFCMLGATGVGKTSLVARYVRSIFSDVYRTTIGVQILSRRMHYRDRDLELLIWDMNGEDEFQHVQLSYVRGASGCIVVVDGTRPSTVATALTLREAAMGAAGPMPCVLAINKVDLEESWDVSLRTLEPLVRVCDGSVSTSARTGAGVVETFERLVDAALAWRALAVDADRAEIRQP